ncbi:NYN domain-containing protein [Kamptonema formosum]|uniref:NYN domain-containing protein n=1 Tax=Kamptonema formosum TaxID=331992 RepID=UPI00034646BB|nr:NYN domain-containing protein [Oscillatoria sp. PCC 10802]
MKTKLHQATEWPTTQPKPLISIYWDCENIKATPDQAKRLMNFANSRGCAGTQRAYAKWRLASQKFEKVLSDLGFDCIDVPDSAKNSVDKKLMADCQSEVEKNPSLTAVILVTGDGDYIKSVRFLQTRGKKVIVFAQAGVASQKLSERADEFHLVDSFSG